MDRIAFHGVDPERLLLWLGLAALIIAALYLIRSIARVTPMTAGVIWERVVGRRKISVKEIISYFLQIVVVAGLLAALSDPQEHVARPKNRAVAVVLDMSASMGAREEDATRMTLAREAARELVTALPSEDLATLVAAGPTPRPLATWSRDRERLLAAIDGIAGYGRGGGNVGDALRTAAEALVRIRPAPTDARLLVLLSDRPHPPPPPVGMALSFHQLLVGSATENVSVTHFEIRPENGPMRGYEVYFQVENHGRSRAKVEVVVHSDEVVFGRIPLGIAPGETAERTYHLDLGKEARPGVGVVARALVTEPSDHLSDDDAAYAVLPPLRILPVTLVTPGNRFLEHALRLNPEVELTVKRPHELGRHAPSGGLVILDRVTLKPLPPLAVLFDPAAARSPFRVERRVARPRLEDWAGEHPLLRGITLHDLYVEEASVFAPDRADVPLVSTEEGPIVVLREGAVLAFGFDLTRSDLPLKVAFPVLLRNILTYFAGWENETRSLPPSYDTSEPVRVSDAGRPVTFDGPEALRPVAYGDGLFTTPHRPGFYEVAPLTAADGGTRTLVGVDFGLAAESEIADGHAATSPEAGIHRLIGASIPDAVKAELTPHDAPPPQRYWMWAVLLALLVTMLDWVLYFLRALE